MSRLIVDLGFRVCSTRIRNDSPDAVLRLHLNASKSLVSGIDVDCCFRRLVYACQNTGGNETVLQHFRVPVDDLDHR